MKRERLLKHYFFLVLAAFWAFSVRLVCFEVVESFQILHFLFVDKKPRRIHGMCM